jgi:hypothetical protein
MEVMVDLVEDLGNEANVYAHTGSGIPLVARASCTCSSHSPVSESRSWTAPVAEESRHSNTGNAAPRER